MSCRRTNPFQLQPFDPCRTVDLNLKLLPVIMATFLQQPIRPSICDDYPFHRQNDQHHRDSRPQHPSVRRPKCVETLDDAAFGRRFF